MATDREKMIADLAAVVALVRAGSVGAPPTEVDFLIVNALLAAIGPGAAAIVLERRRQVTVEGWDDEHDADHDGGELLQAAVAYLDVNQAMGVNAECFVVEEKFAKHVEYRDPWPVSWADEHDKRALHNPARRLAIAGALVAAEYDRMEGEP